MWTRQQRAAKAREDELAANEQQFTAGSLVIREMPPVGRVHDSKLDAFARSRRRS